jgi:alkylated DNA nucleotide flippase Atl1
MPARRVPRARSDSAGRPASFLAEDQGAGRTDLRARAMDDYASRVLDVVDSIPRGQVMSYGDVAEFLGAGGPRQVGRVMALWGGGVAWWRVVHADGSLLVGHERSALGHYEAEGTPLRRPGGDGAPRIDMRRARTTSIAAIR